MFTSSGYFRGVNCPFYIQGRGMCRRPYCHYRHIRTSRETPNVSSTKPVGSVSGNGCSYVATPLANCPTEEEGIETNTSSSGILQYRATPIQKQSSNSSTPAYSYKATPLYGHFGSAESDLTAQEQDHSAPKSIPLEIEEKNHVQSNITSKNNKILKRHHSLPNPEKCLQNKVTSKRYSLDSLLSSDVADGEYDPIVASETLDVYEKKITSNTEFVYHATKKEASTSSSENEMTYHPVKNYSTNTIIGKDISIQSSISKNSNNKRPLGVEYSESVSNKKIKDNAIIESTTSKNNKGLTDVGNTDEMMQPCGIQVSSDDDHTGALEIVESVDEDENINSNNVEEPVETKPKISEEKLAAFFHKMKDAKISTKKSKIIKSFSEMISKKKENIEQNSNLNSSQTIKEIANDKQNLKNEDNEIDLLKKGNDLKQKPIKKTIKSTKLKSKKQLEIGKSDSSKKDPLSKINDPKKAVKLKQSVKTKPKVISSKKSKLCNSKSEGKTKTLLKHKKNIENRISLSGKQLKNGNPGTLSSDEGPKVKCDQKSEKNKHTKKDVESKAVLKSKKDVYSLSSSSDETRKHLDIKPIKKVVQCTPVLTSSKKDVYSLSSSSEENMKLPKVVKRKISIELFGEDSDEEESGNIFKKMKTETSKKKKVPTATLR